MLNRTSKVLAAAMMSCFQPTDAIGTELLSPDSGVAMTAPNAVCIVLASSAAALRRTASSSMVAFFPSGAAEEIDTPRRVSNRCNRVLRNSTDCTCTIGNRRVQLVISPPLIQMTPSSTPKRIRRHCSVRTIEPAE